MKDIGMVITIRSLASGIFYLLLISLVPASAMPLSAQGQSCTVTVSLVSSPNPVETSNLLLGVAEVSANDIWAVGTYIVNHSSTRTLIEHWDGTSWRLVESPSPGRSSGLHDIDALSSSDVWAVGWYSNEGGQNQSLIMHWDGVQWGITPSPSVGGGGNVLYGVAANSANDVWAVGIGSGTLTLHWNGVEWNIIPSPNISAWRNGLYGVTATASNDVWAVGNYVVPGADPHRDQGNSLALALHWNGTSWNVTRTPEQLSRAVYLEGVSALSSDNVWAVGSAQGRPLAMHWDGTQWNVTPTPSISHVDQLKDVIVLSRNDAWAVGTSSYQVIRAIVLHWDGATWSLVPTPLVGSGLNYLEGVAAASSNEIWTVGRYNDRQLVRTMIHKYTNPCAPPRLTATPTPKPVLLTDPVPDPKQNGVQYFPQTGHTLRGAFLDYWHRYGGLAQFGYPLTEELFEPVGTDNKMYQVQYFERNRFELHPENKGTQYEVLLGTLGRDFRQQDPPAAPLPAPAVYYQQTGHNLSGAFKQYWDTHGGLFVHGYPITEPQMERSTNGKEYLVQWFERSRFELHPENAGSPYEVLLGLLGRQLSEKKGYPYGWYPPYGYAADYSWIAGRGVPFRMCSDLECLCWYFAKGDGEVNIVGVAPGNNVTIGISSSRIIHGQLADLSEQRPECRERRGYRVTKVQQNPVR